MFFLGFENDAGTGGTYPSYDREYRNADIEKPLQHHININIISTSSVRSDFKSKVKLHDDKSGQFRVNPLQRSSDCA